MTTTTCRILCVEDNADTCFMLKTLLGASGYEVETAAGVREALERVRSEHYDFFILDTRYPDGFGPDLCRSLRLARPETPVIFYSGAAYDDDRAAGLAAGAARYVVKPAITELVHTVKELLAERPCSVPNAA